MRFAEFFFCAELLPVGAAAEGFAAVGADQDLVGGLKFFVTVRTLDAFVFKHGSLGLSGALGASLVCAQGCRTASRAGPVGLLLLSGAGRRQSGGFVDIIA